MSVLKEEGDHPVTIIGCDIVMGRWHDRPDDMEVKITGQAEDQTTAAWYGELTNSYVQNGKSAGLTRYQVTVNTLHALGFRGEDLSQIQSLVGTATVFSAVKNNKGYMQYYINAHPERIISPADAAAKLRLMFAPAPAAPQQQPQQQYQPQQFQAPQPQQQQAPQFQAPPAQQQYQQPANGTNPFK